jgi:MFS family permease
MFCLGFFASIYHPAGVGLISLHTTAVNRPMALGYHGILGSAGIAAGPFLAGVVLGLGASWRQYFLFLSIPGVLLGALLHFRLRHETGSPRPNEESTDGAPDVEENANWPSFFLLLSVASMGGFVYAAILNFLPRFLDGAGLTFLDLPPESVRNYLAAGVLLLGIVGQYTAGRIAKPTTLEPLMALAFYAAAPCVLWMAFAQGVYRLWAAALWAPLFFMHQPVFNSLVAKYVPRRRRSLCYGLSFTAGFGGGGIGPTFAGLASSNLLNYGVLAGILALAATLALVLWRWDRPVASELETTQDR